MPRYINNLSSPIYFNQTVFVPRQEVETFDTINNQAFIRGTVFETYSIGAGNEDLLIRFNNETAWTTVTLTNGAAQTAADIVADINAAYGVVVAIDEGGYVRLEAPYDQTTSAVYIATTGSTAAATLGFVTSDVNPVDLVATRVFSFSTLAETYNIDATNNTFIFKMNTGASWIIATLTIGAARTAAQIVADINFAYETATADATKVAFAEEPVVGAGLHIKLLAPVYNNFESKIYIKNTGNTALAILGFTGNNFTPVAKSFYPSIVKTNELPLYNPIISETPISFAGAGTYYYYLTEPKECKRIQFIRVSGVGTIFTGYIQNISNIPPFTLIATETLSFNIRNYRITKVIIQASAAGSLTIRELID